LAPLGLWRLTADKIAEIFGTRLSRTMRGKLATVIDRIEHGHHVFRAYFLSEAVRKVRHLPAQRAGLQQPRRFPSQEGIGPSRTKKNAWYVAQSGCNQLF
jgi:hypothetical protein